MNKIFKKIWNKRRGCFVAVSEAMTAACQKGGKATVIGTSIFMLPLTANALVTISGDATYNDLPIKYSSESSSYNYVKDNVHVTGNLIYSNNDISRSLFVGNTSGKEGWGSITITVDKNLTIESDRHWIIAHNHNRGQDVFGSTVVHGDLISHGHITVGTRNVSHDASIKANLTVDGTLFNYGLLNNNEDNAHGDARLVSTISIGKLRNEGVFQHLGGSVTTNIGTIEQVSGLFKQTNNHNVYVSNSVVLSGGTLETSTPVVVGSKSGLFSIGNSLNLAGGVLSNRNQLTQVGGTITVSRGGYDFGTLAKSNGSLSNAGTLVITNFNQSNGQTTNSGNLTIGNANLYGTLSNTGNLTMTGNVTSRGNLSNSGTLHNRGNWTEANNFSIAGLFKNTGTTNFQNGFTLANNGRIESSGTLQTNNALNIFESLGTTGDQELNYVGLNSSVPQEVKTSLNSFFQKYVPGSVAKTLAQHASFTGGKVIISSVNITETQRDDLAKAFKSQFGGATQNEFQGGFRKSVRNEFHK